MIFIPSLGSKIPEETQPAGPPNLLTYSTSLNHLDHVCLLFRQILFIQDMNISISINIII